MMMCNQKLKYEKHYIPCKQQFGEVWIHTHTQNITVFWNLGSHKYPLL